MESHHNRRAVACAVLLACGCHRGDPEVAAALRHVGPANVVEVASGEAAISELPPPPPHAVLDDHIRSAREQAQRALLRPNEPLQPDLAPTPGGPLPGADQPLPPAGLPGFFTSLESRGSDSPLAHFEAALDSLQRGEARAPVRVAVYGASGVSADLWTAYVRAYLQARFGDGGPGIVAAAPPTSWYRHHELELESSKRDWTKHNSHRLEGDQDPGYFGVMGQAMSATSKTAWTQISPRSGSRSATQLASYVIDYLAQPGGGSFRVLLDGELVGEVSTDTSEPTPGLGRERVELEPGSSHRLRIEVEGDGPVRLLGVIAETERPGIVLDTLGVDGAKPSNHRAWNEALWTEHIRARDPVLYLLVFGNNEAVDEDQPIGVYASDYRLLLERFARALPDASCVVVGPDDFPKINEAGELEPRPRLAEIRKVQRELAASYGCAFLDLLALFGGPGSKTAWVAAGLGKDDHLHLTRAGYLRVGMGVADALLQGYDWRAAQAHGDALDVD